MKKYLLESVSACLASLACSLPVEAALHDRGGGLVYDDVMDITWLQDANYGAGSVYDDNDWDGTTDDGRMTPENASLSGQTSTLLGYVMLGVPGGCRDLLTNSRFD